MKNLKMASKKSEGIVTFTDDLIFAKMNDVSEVLGRNNYIYSLAKYVESVSKPVTKIIDNYKYVDIKTLLSEFNANKEKIHNILLLEGKERNISSIDSVARQLSDLKEVKIDDDVDIIMNHLARMQEKLVKSESEVQDKIFKATQLVEDMENKYASLESEYKSQAVLFSSQSIELEKLKKENAKLKAESEKKKEANPKEISALLSQIDKSEAKYEELKNINLDLAKENSTLKQELNELRIFKSTVLTAIKPTT